MPDERERLTAELARQSRLLARQLVRFYDAVADQLGLHVTDLICLATLRDRGRATIGELAAELGLTTGAVSRMVDRLQAGGFVRRARDPSDARRVLVELATTESTVGLFAPQFADLTESVADLSADQLRLLLAHLKAQTTISREAADRVRRAGRPHATRRTRS
ncbi:MAG TPA: MarR family transcriptional regulator [Natronosporangium sp.]|nr:MarR family transcriptional regulator [Natronosporangium sp.]